MSLNTHLRTSGDHAVLPFDPACPICRDERLAGRLPNPTLVPPRLTALAVAGVTAGCTLAPAPAALAQAEPPIVLPPGGEEDPGEEALEDEGPLVEDEPVESDEPDPNMPPVIPDDPALAIEPSDPPPPTDPSVLGGAPVPEGLDAAPPAAPPVTPPAVVPPAPAQGAPERDRGEPRRAPQQAPRHHAERHRAPRPAAAAPSEAAPAPVRAATTGPATTGPTHVVRPGDSLWSIASARLGPAASPAAVAALVQAIWRANAAVIRTGDPDLLHPGTRLVLPGAPR